MNIFTQENVAKYNTKNRAAGVGEYVKRNGVWAMDIRPEPFYKNFGEESYILRNEFEPNTQYIIDLWIDGDDVISTQGNYTTCGLRVVYTDGTTDDTLSVIGGDGVGWQHKKFVTNASKSVKEMLVRYYYNLPTYYRADSYITPLANTSKILKTGVIQSGEFDEPQFASIGKGYIDATNFVEI